MKRTANAENLRCYALEEVWRGINRFFHTYGYLSRPCAGTGADSLWEVRFILDSKRQVAELESLLWQSGYDRAKRLRKYGKHQLALPGRNAVELIEELWDHVLE
jgi:hypothetical protein